MRVRVAQRGSAAHGAHKRTEHPDTFSPLRSKSVQGFCISRLKAGVIALFGGPISAPLWERRNVRERQTELRLTKRTVSTRSLSDRATSHRKPPGSPLTALRTQISPQPPDRKASRSSSSASLNARLLLSHTHSNMLRTHLLALGRRALRDRPSVRAFSSATTETEELVGERDGE